MFECKRVHGFKMLNMRSKEKHGCYVAFDVRYVHVLFMAAPFMFYLPFHFLWCFWTSFFIPLLMLQRFKCGLFQCRKKCDIHIVKYKDTKRRLHKQLDKNGIIVHILNTLLWTSHLTTGFILASVSMLLVYFPKTLFICYKMPVNGVKQSSHTAENVDVETNTCRILLAYFTYITCWLYYFSLACPFVIWEHHGGSATLWQLHCMMPEFLNSC